MTDLQQTSSVTRNAKETPLIDPATFALEEYKAIQTKINQHRDTVSRLETFTIGGTVAGVGFLLGIGRTRCDDFLFTRFAWWGLVALVVAAGLRCWAYYFYIYHLRKYVMEIERQMKSANYQLEGIETFSQGKWLVGLYIVMLLLWSVLIGTLLILSFGHTSCGQIAT